MQELIIEPSLWRFAGGWMIVAAIVGSSIGAALQFIPKQTMSPRNSRMPALSLKKSASSSSAALTPPVTNIPEKVI